MKIEPVPSSTVPVEGIRLQGRLAQIDVTGNLVVKLFKRNPHDRWQKLRLVT